MSRQILESTMLDSMLKARGIKVNAKPCCGRPPQIKYGQYLARLGFHGDFAIRVRGVITEMCHVD